MFELYTRSSFLGELPRKNFPNTILWWNQCVLSRCDDIYQTFSKQGYWVGGRWKVNKTATILLQKEDQITFIERGADIFPFSNGLTETIGQEKSQVMLCFPLVDRKWNCRCIVTDSSSQTEESVSLTPWRLHIISWQWDETPTVKNPPPQEKWTESYLSGLLALN